MIQKIFTFITVIKKQTKIKQKNWNSGNLKAIPSGHLAHSHGLLKHRLSSTFLRICSGLPRLNLAYYDQTPSQSTLMSTQLSLIMQDRSCSLKLSLFPPPQNIRGPKQWVIMKSDQWKGPLIWGAGGKVMYGLIGERERERGSEGMYERCGCRAGDLEVRRRSGTPPKHPPISSAGAEGAQWAWRLAALLVCVLFRVQTSVLASLKILKSGNVVPVQIFPLPDRTLWCQFLNVEWLNCGKSVSRWTHSGKQTSQSSL